MSGRPRTRFAAAAVLLTALAGCASDSGDEAGLAGEDAEVSPSIRGFRDGLEVQWWVVRSDPGPVLQTLTGPERALDAQTAEVWAANGLRVLSIETERLPELGLRLRVVGGQSGLGQWLGQAPRWTPLIEGPSRGPTGVSMESGLLALPAGRLRLLGRAWSEPAPGQLTGGEACRSHLRVEIVPQHAETASQDSVDAVLGLAPRSRDPLDEGLVLRRLAATLRLDGREAILIVPERPDVVWGARGEEPENDAEAEPEREADGASEADPRSSASIGQVIRHDPTESFAEAAADAGQVGPSGPRGPRLPTLGEAMLMSTRREEAGARVIVVLAARLPERFRLLPD